MQNSNDMKKEWRKNGKDDYSLFLNNEEQTNLTFSTKSMKRPATFKLNGKAYIIQRSGFWKTKLEILDEHGIILAQASPRSWFSSGYLFKYKSHSYTVILKNSPLAQWKIMEGNVEIMHYGLKSNKEVVISENSNQHDVIFDVLLWYLMEPIVTENADDFVTFILLTTA